MKEFNQWLFEALEIKTDGGRLGDPHQLYQNVDLYEASLSYVDGLTPEQFAKEI